VVGDDLVPVGRHERLPLRAGRRGEPGHGVVEVADEAGRTAKLAAAVQLTETAGPGDHAGDEGQDIASPFVDAERAGRAVEADRVEMGEQRVHGWRPGPGRPPVDVAHADDPAAHVAAAQRYLSAWHTTARARNGMIQRRSSRRRLIFAASDRSQSETPRSVQNERS